MPRTTLTSAMTPIASGEPIAGMTKNGTTNVPTIAPRVFAARSRPALVATLPSRPATSADEAGKLRPMTIVAGRTTTKTRQNRTLISPSMWPASTVNSTGSDRTKTTPARARKPTIDVGPREQRDRPPDPPPDEGEQHRADRDPAEEDDQDQGEDVRVVAGPRREETRPEDLVGEGRQAGDERDHEREARTRVLVRNLVSGWLRLRELAARPARPGPTQRPDACDR